MRRIERMLEQQQTATTDSNNERQQLTAFGVRHESPDAADPQSAVLLQLLS
jgi:hypothetical protein